MKLEPRTFVLKDGRRAVLRSAAAEDAAEMLDYLRVSAGETEFILRYPEECTWTLEQEAELLRSKAESPDEMMIVCDVEGKLAGNCALFFNSRIKVAHRASVAIALCSAYWNLGIGTAMFQTMIDVARERPGVMQMELDFVEGNTRARALYEKMGFRIVGVKPNAIRLKDGTLLNEYSMMLSL